MLLGSFVGGILGAVVGLPIPVAGPVIGVLLFAGSGALVGAVAGEYSVRRELKGSLKVGAAAFWGRIFGSVGKSLIGGVMVVLYLVSLIIWRKLQGASSTWAAGRENASRPCMASRPISYFPIRRDTCPCASDASSKWLVRRFGRQNRVPIRATSAGAQAAFG